MSQQLHKELTAWVSKYPDIVKKAYDLLQLESGDPTITMQDLGRKILELSQELQNG